MSAIQRATSDDDKKHLLAEFSAHLEEAQKERDAYIAAIDRSKQALAANREYPAYAHITFEFCSASLSPISFSAGGPTLLQSANACANLWDL